MLLFWCLLTFINPRSILQYGNNEEHLNLMTAMNSQGGDYNQKSLIFYLSEGEMLGAM